MHARTLTSAHLLRRMPAPAPTLALIGATLQLIDPRTGDRLSEHRLPPELLRSGDPITNVMFQRGGARWLITEDEGERAWMCDGERWSEAAKLPHANTLTDLCYLWADEPLYLRQNFGINYFTWRSGADRPRPSFERLPAIRVRQQQAPWLQAVERQPGRGCQIHRTWQDTEDLVYHLYDAPTPKIGYVSWADPERDWSVEPTKPCLRLAGSADWLFSLVDGADGGTEIIAHHRGGGLLTIAGPEGASLWDVETVITEAWSGLVAIAQPDARPQPLLVTWTLDELAQRL